ncbi:RNA polymerase-associated protein LEO1-like [Microplitis mediator]|uniref:RNA polymerase-associated protein LEO1-like n=1 Tax=Microplitis mediator TaxID=375433 RepID=UPI0025555149|nr:RNA polymerase-associated protein LEO1-like [Microplitis mediator]
MSGSESEAGVTPNKAGMTRSRKGRGDTPVPTRQEAKIPNGEKVQVKNKRGRPKGTTKTRGGKLAYRGTTDRYLNKGSDENGNRESQQKGVEANMNGNDEKENAGNVELKQLSEEEDEKWDDVSSDNNLDETVVKADQNKNRKKGKDEERSEEENDRHLLRVLEGLREEMQNTLRNIHATMAEGNDGRGEIYGKT